jgi:arginase family enzyme
LPAFKNPTYLTFDVDCLDPAFAPGTGTPVVGGLSTFETQTILRELKIKNLVGADVVEVSPPYDHSDITSLAAVDVIFECLGFMAES